MTAALRRDTIRYQVCLSCGSAQTLRRLACQRCGQASLEWREASGDGCVYAITRVHRAPDDAFRALAPYALALIDMDEGYRLMGHAELDLAIGDRVTGRITEIADQMIVAFARAGGET